MKNGIFVESLTEKELNALIENKLNYAMEWVLSELKKNRDLISRKAACKLLGVSVPTIIKMTKDERLYGYKINGEVKYRQCDIEGYIKSCAMEFEGPLFKDDLPFGCD